MKSLREIESIILNTDCDDYLVDGWYRSQPILTKDENGVLMDNYFMYGQDFEGTVFWIPYAVFGIYSDEEKTAYKKETPDSEVKKITTEEKIDRLAANKAYDRYEKIYPQVRECAYSENCTDEQKAIVKEYVSCLEAFSAPVVWKCYLEMFPSFFEWVKSLG